MENPRETIDGYTYEVELLPTGQALDVHQDLVQRLLGPAAGHLEEGDIGKAFSASVTNLPPGWLRQTSELFAKKTTVHLPSGKAPILNAVYAEHFKGAIGRHHKWLVFCIKANFSDFLGDLQGLVSRAFSQASSVANSPTSEDTP